MGAACAADPRTDACGDTGEHTGRRAAAIFADGAFVPQRSEGERFRGRLMRWLTMKILRRAGLTAALVSVVALFGFDLGMQACPTLGAPPPPAVAADVDGTFSITGSIDERLVDVVQAAIAAPRGPIRRVRHDSAGGYDDAMRHLSVRLSRLPSTIEVPHHATCRSACVGLLACAPGPILRPAPAGTGVQRAHFQMGRDLAGAPLMPPRPAGCWWTGPGIPAAERGRAPSCAGAAPPARG